MMRFATRAKSFHEVEDWFETTMIRKNGSRSR